MGKDTPKEVHDFYSKINKKTWDRRKKEGNIPSSEEMSRRGKLGAKARWNTA